MPGCSSAAGSARCQPCRRGRSNARPAADAEGSRRARGCIKIRPLRCLQDPWSGLPTVLRALDNRAPSRRSGRPIAACCRAPVPRIAGLSVAGAWSIMTGFSWAAGPGAGRAAGMPGHGNTGPVGGGADVGDGCEQRVLPEVAGLPADDLVEQAGFGPAVKGCRGQHGVLELLVCRPWNVHSGRKRSRISSGDSGLVRLAPRQSSASAARCRKTSPGKVLSRGCSGASSSARSQMPASRVRPSSRIRRAVRVSSVVGRFRAGIPRR